MSNKQVKLIHGHRTTKGKSECFNQCPILLIHRSLVSLKLCLVWRAKPCALVIWSGSHCHSTSSFCLLITWGHHGAALLHVPPTIRLPSVDIKVSKHKKCKTTVIRKIKKYKQNIEQSVLLNECRITTIRWIIMSNKILEHHMLKPNV